MRPDGQSRVPARDGFTLIEVLVVIAIIGTLVAVTLPAVQAARESSRRTACQNNLRQLGVATLVYAERHGELPTGCIGCKFTTPPPGGPPVKQRFISWNVQILPMLDQRPLWEAFDLSLPSYHATNKLVGAHVLDVFLCPSTTEDSQTQTKGLWKGVSFTDYAGIYGVEGPGRNATDPNATHWLRNDSLGVMLYEHGVLPAAIRDGVSRTAAVAETMLRRRTESEWVNGHNVFAQESATPVNDASGIGNDIGSPHPGGASLVFCDGHVEFVSETIAQKALLALLTKAGGE
jgi:prepilin-type N-terminal cleavage/methylation domain-containing protein/prepilin-type processing-associated H-X9-DG protein